MQSSTSRGMMHPHANEANDIAPSGLRCQRMLDGTNCDAPQQSRLLTRRSARGSSPIPNHQSLDDMERFYAQFESTQTAPDDWFTEDHTRFFENIEDIQEIADAITAVGITPKGSDILEEQQGHKSSRLTRRQASAEKRMSTASENSQMDDVLALLNSEIQSPQRPRSPRLSSPRTRSPSMRSPTMHSPTPRTRSPTRGGSPTIMSPTRTRSPKPARRMSIDQENMPTTPKGGRKSFDTQSTMSADFKELPSKRASVGSRRNSIDAGNMSYPLSPTMNERRFSDLSIF